MWPSQEMFTSVVWNKRWMVEAQWNRVASIFPQFSVWFESWASSVLFVWPYSSPSFLLRSSLTILFETVPHTLCHTPHLVHSFFFIALSPSSLLILLYLIILMKYRRAGIFFSFPSYLPRSLNSGWHIVNAQKRLLECKHSSLPYIFSALEWTLAYLFFAFNLWLTF